jgi:eukaryotic-like serine/threonine-protein kinase
MNDGFAANSTISHYRIVSRIGVGGMGEVYRGYDSRLDREVAIKMLPPDFASNEDRLRRFEQEAKATSALNHPNILTVYDIGEHEGSPFIVAELLDGEELRDRLDEGPIPLRKTIDYAQQIVSGLSAAHERGIAHRDLKPENLFVTKDDRVKILDFGLAKLLEREKSSDGSEDATKKALTDPGVVMGTVGYMSPEQVRGLPADHRSDIFSFGVILYEMLTGRQAFRGESVVETMHSVLKDDVPELDETNAKVPPALDKLMRRCLEKRPEHRFHSAHDLGFALDALASPTSTSGSGLTTAVRTIDEGSAPSGSNWLAVAAWGAAGLFLVSTVILGALYFRRVESPRPTVRFAIAPPEKSEFSGLALSPDGGQIAFATVGAAGTTSLWVRSVDSLDSRQLAGTEGAAFPFWSPDNRTIGFFAGNKLRKIDAGGGPSQTLADATVDPRGGTWTLDGTIIFSPATTSPLMRVSTSGGPATELTKLDAELGQTSHRWPSMMPDGRHFLYFARGTQPEKQGIYVGSVDSPVTKLLIAAPVTGAYAEADGMGYLLFVRESSLVAQRFDTSSFTLSGDAVPLAQGIYTVPGEVGPTAFSAFSVSSGNLLYFNGSVPTTRFTWFDRMGKPLGVVTEPGQYHEPSLSSADTKVLFGGSDGTAPGDIYLQDLSRGSTTRLTFDPAQESSALLSPDESQIVFSSNRSGANGIYRKPANGAGNDQLLLAEPNLAFPDSWSRDGRYLLFEKNSGAGTRFDLWVLPMIGDPTPFPYLETAFQETHSQFSQDGRWVAYASDESGRTEVYIQSFPIGNGKWQVSTAGGDQPQWGADGKELFYMAADRNLMAVSINGSAALEIGRPEVLFQTNTPITGITDDRNNFVPARDGRRFMINTLDETKNAQPLTFVLNWPANLKQ